MKRILLETLFIMAVLVFLASLHGRVSSIKENSLEVGELRELVRTTAESLGSMRENHQAKIDALMDVQGKLTSLEQRVAQANFSTAEAQRLKHEISSSRKEAAAIKAQLAQDIARTQETVDAYQAEMRSMRRADNANLRQTRSDITLLADHLRRDPKTLSRHLLAPAVQLNGDDTVGSGTLIHSGKNPKSKENETYVITSYHVVRNILADTPRAKREGISVTIYDPKAGNGKEELRCDIVSFDAKIDAALLKLRTKRVFRNVARVIEKADATDIQVWDPIYAVGCPLGNDPIPSQGEVSSLNNELNGANYWMINAPTYFGNSGGGIYLADSRELAGVFSKIYTHGRGTPVVIPHMGLFTPMPAIYEWLEREKLAFVLTNDTVPTRRPTINIEHLASPPK